MNDEIKNEKQLNNQQSQQETGENKKTPHQLYLEEKNEREKLQETLQNKDTEYQLGLIGLNKEISALKSSVKKKDDEIQITKEKYWSDKESDVKNSIERRSNSVEGFMVKSMYDYLDKRAEEGKFLKQRNLFFI